VTTVRVTTLGGIIGEKGMNVAGSPFFRTGDECVLFLERDGKSGWRCKGWSQGCYQVITDPVSKARSVQGNTSGVSLLGKGPSKLQEGTPGKPMSLSGFLDTVRGHVAAKGGAR
jgi:hypothetical protein